MYQGRYFGDNPKYPKYTTGGNPTTTLNIHSGPSGVGNSICIVEDFISAIKVSRVLTSIPMWGSNFTQGQLKQLSSMFSKVIWWVDPDKQRDYPKLINKSGIYFDEIQCVYSEADPKYYDTEEIKCLLSK
jgi:hypothetical protein